MINSELSEISYVIQAGVTTYPIGFEYHFNENNSPQLLVKIGESVAIINVDFQLSTDESEIILIPTEEEAQAQNGPNDTRWMDRIVGEELLITRDIPFVQTSDYTVGRISPEQIEYDFDRTVMRDQEILHQLSDFTVDVALAESLANAAVETANEAATAANQATATANTALETANTASVTANDAKDVATQASQDAVDAIADSANAVNKAEAADMTATTAMEIAAEAVTLAQNVYSKTEIDNKITVINADIDANAEAIQKTREDYIEADSDIHTILNNHAGELTTLHNDVDAVGDQVSGIEEKIPGTASASNPLVTKQQLLDEEMDIREDLNSGLSELQTQVTAQAAAIANKQDTLTAGENITIVDNVISATGGGGDFLPLAGGTMTGPIVFDLGEVSSTLDSVEVLQLNLIKTGQAVPLQARISYSGLGQLGLNGLGISGLGNLIPNGSSYNVGGTFNKWKCVYATQLNNGANIAIPTTGGTMALVEDINAIGGEGTTGQVLTKTDDGFTWQDSAGGTAEYPDQTNRAGRFLQTDGTSVSWSPNLIINESNSSVSIGVSSSDAANHATAIGGLNAVASGEYSVAVGSSTEATAHAATSIGFGTSANAISSTAVGNASSANSFASIAIGYLASASAWYSVQIGRGTNTIEGSLQFKDYTVVSNDGTIPTDRYTTTPTSAGTYIPKLIIAEDGTVSREWGTDSAGGTSLPDQTDNAGKFLTTDGTTPSWSDKPLVNNTDHATSIGIGSKATRGAAVVIGTGITTTTNFSVTIGANASTNTASSVAIGYAAGASNYSIALGRQMSASAEHSIQIGCASGMISNTDPNTFKVYNGVDNYEMMDANGNVPLERLTYVTNQIGDISTALTAIIGE